MAEHSRLADPGLIILLLMLLIPMAAADSANALSFQHITATEGLSQNSAQALLQDRHGYLWVGTQDGLNRFDGYGFVTYRQGFAPGSNGGVEHIHHPGLSSSTIWTLYEDSVGTLWVGTVDGLNRFEPGSNTFRHYRHLSDDPTSLSHATVRAIIEDGQQRLWVGTSRGGLNLMDREQGSFRHYRHNPDNTNSPASDRISAMARGHDDALWIGTEDAGISRFDPQSTTFTHYRHVPDNNNSLSSNNITAIMVDRDGMVWVGTDDAGLNRLDPETGDIHHYRHDPLDPDSISFDSLRAIYEDSQGRLWIGHYLGGALDLFDREQERFIQHRHQPGVPDSLNHDHLLSILEDSSGILWFGTHMGGLNKYDARRDRFRHIQHRWWDPDSLSNNTVRAFRQFGQILFVGTEGGLNAMDLHSGRFRHYQHNPDNPEEGLLHNVVRNMTLDANGQIWLATHGGLTRMDPATQTFTHFLHDPQDPYSLSDNVVWRVFIDSQDMVWVGTRDALNRLDPETGRVERFIHDPSDPYSIGGDRIIAIFEDSRGHLWFSTVAAGVNRFDRDSGHFTRFRHDPANQDSIADDTIFAIYEDSSGALWFGSRGGLDRLDPQSGHFYTYTRQHGLPNNVVYGILSDDLERFWLSTNRGLALFDPNKETVISFGRGDGLQDDEFNNGAYYRSADGLMYFGGVNGFNVFDPSSIVQSDFEPPVLITDFRVLNEVRLTEPGHPDQAALQLSHTENYLSFEFASLDFSAPQYLRYQYQLEGFESEWVDAGQRRFANYTNLPPGQYVFRARGTNADGVWSPHEAQLSLHIRPAYWQTAWFQLGVALGLLLLILLLHFFRTAEVRRRNAELGALVYERTAELQRINANLKHEVEQRRQAEEEIRLIAYNDPLTGLPNRRLFSALSEQMLQTARRSRSGFCVLFLDLNTFKEINDRWGHEAGDTILVRTAERIREVIRGGDIAARIGGDEFVLVLNRANDREKATAIANKLLATLEAPVIVRDPSNGREQALKPGISIGIALYPQHGDTLEALLHKADQAMYRAKQDSGHSLYFAPDPDSQTDAAGS